MIANGGNTEGLFRGAFMQSGAPIPVGDITHGQIDYDELVARTKCSVAKDTLQCLRHVPFDTLKDAVDRSPGIFSYNVSAVTIALVVHHLSLTVPVSATILVASCRRCLPERYSTATGCKRKRCKHSLRDRGE